VDRRREERVNSNEAVQVTILGSEQERIQGHLINLSGKGLRIVVPAVILPGTLLRIDTKDSILLGEVSHWTKQDGGIQIGVQIEHVLTNLKQLAKLRESLLEESGPIDRVSHGVG
jgi:hypothetical protein